MNNFSSMGFGIRFLFALVLVFSTYNPSSYSYSHWLVGSISNPSPWLALAGIVLIIGWVIYIRASLRSLGPIGLTLASILVAIIIWACFDLGWLSFEQPSIFVWVLEFFIAAILSIGMSWSHIRRRMSGQVDVDDV